MFTRKHYKAIAEIIKKRLNLNQGTRHTPRFLYADEVADDLADYFAGDNPRFDRERFLTACGIGPEPEPEHLCEQCKTDMGSEWILGPVCGKCCRKNHKQACGTN